MLAKAARTFVALAFCVCACADVLFMCACERENLSAHINTDLQRLSTVGNMLLHSLDRLQNLARIGHCDVHAITILRQTVREQQETHMQHREQPIRFNNQPQPQQTSSRSALEVDFFSAEEVDEAEAAGGREAERDIDDAAMEDEPDVDSLRFLGTFSSSSL